MRLIYTLAWLVLLPVAFLYLLWRARRQPDYLRHWGERLGAAPRLAGRPVIWVHAVSVGETHAAAPLIRALLDRHPDHALLLTHATPTGRAAGASLFGARVVQAYLPYDLPFLVKRFLRRTRPALGIVMETEIWPNLLAACQQADIPVSLVNARMSEKSAAGYARFQPLVRQALHRFSLIAAQSGADAVRLQQLGAEDVRVTGNMKFDIPPPADTPTRATELRQAFGRRFVLLAASTRDGEEALILDAIGTLELPDLLLVIVPRHPQRFSTVADLVAGHDTRFARRSRMAPVGTETRVFLGDSMGEMAAYYAACDIAFIGGSLLPLGGQNLIEAAAAGRPVLIGPYTWNFGEASEQAVASGAALRVRDAAELAAVVARLYRDPGLRQRMGKAGLVFAQNHRGATQQVMALLAPYLPGGSGR